MFTSNIVWTNMKSSMSSSIRPAFICPRSWVWNCYPCYEKTHKTLNTKTYTANNKNNNIKNCSSSRFKLVNICARDPTVQACKYAHEGPASSSAQVFARETQYALCIIALLYSHTLQEEDERQWPSLHCHPFFMKYSHIESLVPTSWPQWFFYRNCSTFRNIILSAT